MTDQLESIINAIYEAPYAPECWQFALQAIAKHLRVINVSIAAHEFESNQFETINLPIDPAFVTSYERRWASRNFLFQSSHKLPVGHIFGFDVAMPLEQFRRTDFYNEWWRPQRLDQALGSNLIRDGSFSAVATIYRPSSAQEFSPREVECFRKLLPYLERSMQLRRRLAPANTWSSGAESLISAIDKPAIILTKHAHILYMNRCCEGLIADQSLGIDREGRLTALVYEETERLQNLVFHLNSTAVGAVGKVIVRRRDRSSIIILLYSLKGGYIDNRARCIAFIEDPERVYMSKSDIKILTTRYGLSNKEAQLTQLLLKGASLRNAAMELDIKYETARTHLAHVFQKTGTHTQAALSKAIWLEGYNF